MTITFPLPVELQGVGRVKGRFILVSPDTINDPDVYPEARASSGTVTFTPASRRHGHLLAAARNPRTSVGWQRGSQQDFGACGKHNAHPRPKLHIRPTYCPGR